MLKIRNSNEDEMILEFLKGEINSKRFNEKLYKVLSKLELNVSIITSGDVLNSDENTLRKNIMKLYRGYPDSELFNNFPKIDKWCFVKLSSEDIDNMYYINYDYWNELSNNTSKPIEAAKTIKSGKEIYDVSNKQYLDGLEELENGKEFPPVILITCNEKKLLIIEGHVRMTIYALDRLKLDGTYAYIGYCKKEEMDKYDSRMI